MTATSTETSTSAVGAATGFRPKDLALVIGGTFAGITALSYLAELLWAEDWNVEYVEKVHDTHEYFINIPGPFRLAFYVTMVVTIVYGGWMFSNRMRNWPRGAPEGRLTTKKNLRSRAESLRAGLYMKTLMRDPAAGIMHSLIYFSFLILLAVTTVGEINLQLPIALKFLHGGTYQGFAFTADVAGITFTAGVIWAIVRRYIQRPYRIRIKTRPEHALILGVLLAIGVTGFLTEMFRIAYAGMPSFEKWSILGYPLATLVDGLSTSTLSGLHRGMWVVHILTFVAFLVILPSTMLRHMFTAPINMYLHDRDRPKGAMKAMPNLMETELESFGVDDQRFHLEAAARHRLVHDVRTLHRCVSGPRATGKSLDPREIVLKTGEVMAATGNPVVSPPIGIDPEITITADSIFERVTPEELWACTTCKACDEACPVDIEILDKILDMRRYLSLMESNFPTELGMAYRGMENSGNPWGLSQSERGDWAKDIEGIKILGEGDAVTAEYLYWVGCAGSFDDKNKKVTQAMAKLLQRAGVDFAILGPSENCTGDPARRSGNEYLFQMLAMQNIEALESMGVRKIITQCPHCFNTVANEYPQLGGHYQVIHHTQMLEDLVEGGQLDLTDARLDERVVYHDSCYLGRHNDIYMAPRKVIGKLKGIEIVEAPRNGTKGMCCGAGGARMWMEEHEGKQINVERSQELIATGATRIATACPYCYIMIDDGVKSQGVEDDQVKVADIAIHVLEALENVEPGSPSRAGAEMHPTSPE